MVTTAIGSNQALVGQGFAVLRESLAPYMCREFQLEYGKSWWERGVLSQFPDMRDLPMSGSYAELEGSLDIAAALALLTGEQWRTIFKKKLPWEVLNWAKELRTTRNNWAHLGAGDLSDSDTWRALDTMSRVANQIDPDAAEDINKLLRTVRYGSQFGSIAAEVPEEATRLTPKVQREQGILGTVPSANLHSWRDIMVPHPDVAAGRYKTAEFAADLNQVARGNAEQEYQDPQEFFSRTYVTEGMEGLLEEALRRVNGEGGEPVIQLKTAFGGGKTHSMLALYHMFRNRGVSEKIPAVRKIMERADAQAIPETAVAVIVGTSLNPAKHKRPSDLPGITVNTIWGEIAYQLARARNDPSLYEYVREADKKGVSPGSEALRQLFDAAGPSVVLMDELVAYAKLLGGRQDLPAGTFDNFISFIQALTEAITASKNSIVVASIPQSTIEVGGETGQTTLAQIEHTFGRMESVWKPVAANESFEVVRRRLFLDCKDQESKEAVCEAFSRMYTSNEQEFPIDARQPEYKRRLLASYPIHPEMFDRLYEDWGDLERFQKTRGVLRLMAAVIHQLWMAGDQSLLIMPGSVPMNVPSVRDELTRYLSEGWNAVVDKEVDGPNSLPYQLEQEKTRFAPGLAVRRVARTIMLGSAPVERDQKLPGLDTGRIRLGTVQPGESIALFNDALSTLGANLSYLYENSAGDRFWYDTRPTLRRTALDKANSYSAPDVESEIVRRLGRLKKVQPFEGIHPAPLSTVDVPDNDRLRLVLLPPKTGYLNAMPDNDAVKFATEILEKRGDNVRQYKNRLMFVAPDQSAVGKLRDDVRMYLAWQSIHDTREELNLDMRQIKEAKQRRDQADDAVQLQLCATYKWLMVPKSAAEGELRTISWNTLPFATNIGNNLVQAAADRLDASGYQVIGKWVPDQFLPILNDRLWKEGDTLSVKTLWDYFCSYLYLPRLQNEDVLKETLRECVLNKKLGYASGYNPSDAEHPYANLVIGQPAQVDGSGVLVRAKIAEELVEKEPIRPDENPPRPLHGEDGTTKVEPGVRPPTAPGVQMPTHFHMSMDIDSKDPSGPMLNFIDEILPHLRAAADAEMTITLDVTADTKSGFDKKTIRIVSENCNSVGIHSFGFEE